MWIMIRQGSAARNLEALLPLVLRHGPRNCLLCTDDREPDELLDEGHINAVMRDAVALGCPPDQAVAMGTLQAARYHRLEGKGAVAPGYIADIVRGSRSGLLPPDRGMEARPAGRRRRRRAADPSGRASGVDAGEHPSGPGDGRGLRRLRARPGQGHRRRSGTADDRVARDRCGDDRRPCRRRRLAGPGEGGGPGATPGHGPDRARVRHRVRAPARGSRVLPRPRRPQRDRGRGRRRGHGGRGEPPHRDRRRPGGGRGRRDPRRGAVPDRRAAVRPPGGGGRRRRFDGCIRSPLRSDARFPRRT